MLFHGLARGSGSLHLRSACMATADSLRSRAPGRGAKMERDLRAGLKVDPYFCPAEPADVFDTVEWELRSAAIKDENGKVMFEQKDCEIPATWSQLATN